MSTAATLEDDRIPRTIVDRRLERGCKAAINWWITKSNATLAASKRRQNFNAPSSCSSSWYAFKLLFLLYCADTFYNRVGGSRENRKGEQTELEPVYSSKQGIEPVGL
jgi:hypothetical protein